MKFYFYLTSLLLFLWSVPVLSQTTISGKILDQDTGEELIFATVVISKKGVFYAKTNTDFDGNYRIEVVPGEFDVEFSYIGYSTRKVSGVEIKERKDFMLNHELSSNENSIICCPGIISYRIPLIEQDVSTPGTRIVRNRVRENPGKDIPDLILNTPGVTISRF